MTADLALLTDDQLVGEMRRREHGQLYAPRPPFHVGVVVGDDVAVPSAIVIGPHTRRGYAWQGGAIVDDAGRAIATAARAGRVSIDARALADAAFADATAGPWLVAGSDRDDRAPRYQRITPGFTVGRGTDAHLQLQSGTIARQHCRFELEGGRWFVEDLRSTNGTYIDRTRVTRAALDDRTRLDIADRTVEFRATLSPPRRVIDPSDQASWGGLFLDRVELDVLSANIQAGDAEVPPMLPIRAGQITWRLAANPRARDARWLFATTDDASVWFDALVAREGDELPPPIVGDDCACFAADPRVVIVARVGAIVARLERIGDLDHLDGMAAAIARRAA